MSHNTLGCLKNPAMDSRDQAAKLKKEMERIFQLTCSYGLSKVITKLAYFSMYLPAVQYALSSSQMSKKSLNSAQTKATRRFLAGMGFNPNMPRTAAYTSKQLRGIRMQRLHTTQGVKNVTQMLKHLRANTTEGKLFRIDVDWLQRWSGIGMCVMAKPERQILPTSAKYLVIPENSLRSVEHQYS